WEKFNIGVGNTVEFKQPGASSVALNRIFQSDPSAIMGKLQANGQVFLLNPNGFVFGKDSRVNVNSLVASSLNISDDTFQKGVTKVFNQDGRAALEGTGQVYRLNEKGEFVLDAQGQKIKTSIEFQKGSEVNVAKSGRIIAAAPSVVNQGTLRAPEGQIIAVASSDKVYLQEAQGDPSLRGLVVEVANGGDVTNLGKMVSAKGNTTLLGFAVNQKGIVSASTSVQANGSVRLLAREGATARREGNKWLLQPGRTQRTTALDDGLGTRAKVTLAKGSLTQATPDQADLATAVDGLAQTPSRIEVMGKDVVMEGGAVIRSNAGRVTLSATENPADPAQPNVKNDSKVSIASGALIDVSGLKNINVPISRNIVEVELRTNELRDAPLQKTGVLYAQKIRVDIREGTPIADITGALDRISRTVAERSTQGGSLDIVSEGKSNLAAGSVIDYSGGSILWTPGYINTTKLIGPDGLSVVDISKANPNVKYLGIVGGITQYFPSWNFSQTAKIIGPVDHVEPAYIEGKSAGSLNIKTALLSLESEMQAAAVNGTRQRTPETQALGGQLSIDLARTQTETQAVVFGRKKKQDDLQLNADKLKASGLNSLAVNTNAAIAVQSGQTIQLSPGGKVSLKGGEVNLDGNIIVRSGDVELQTHLVGVDDSVNGAIRLGEASMIDTSGVWNNERPAVSDRKDQFDASLVRIDGGKVSIKAEGDVDLSPGSFIDVSGAAHRGLNRTVKAGDAGAISIIAAAIDGSDVSLGGQMTGYAVAGGQGGSLSLTSDRVIIGNQAAKPVGKDESKPLRLSSEFFTQGGFQSYAVSSNKSGLTVTDNTRVKVSVQNRILDASASGRKSGENLRLFSRNETLPDLIQPAGDLSLKLSQQVGFGGKTAAVSIGKGAELATGVGGKLSVSSDGSILMNGALTAKSGAVNLSITPPSLTDAGFLPNQGVWLGSTARIDVGGVSRIYQ
ncbi:MAG: filamentous hemagglutinin N-terminal domain-containing protein, partial [Methylococcus sp.]